MKRTLLTPRLKLTLVEEASRGTQEFEWMHELRSDEQTTWWRYNHPCLLDMSLYTYADSFPRKPECDKNRICDTRNSGRRHNTLHRACYNQVTPRKQPTRDESSVSAIYIGLLNGAQSRTRIPISPSSMGSWFCFRVTSECPCGVSSKFRFMEAVQTGILTGNCGCGEYREFRCDEKKWDERAGCA
jgi:hypothetical protein